MDIQGHNVLCRGDSRCKSTESGGSLTCSRNSTTIVSRAEEVRVPGLDGTEPCKPW